MGVRWRSREELRRRLCSVGFDPAEVEVALADLEDIGLIEDGRFAREMARDQAGRRLAGNRSIRAGLLQKGVAREHVDEALQDAGDESERALELARQRAARLAGLDRETVYRRLYGLLVRRGYLPGTARAACTAALGEVLEGGSVPEGE